MGCGGKVWKDHRDTHSITYIPCREQANMINSLTSYNLLSQGHKPQRPISLQVKGQMDEKLNELALPYLLLGPLLGPLIF